MRLMNSINCIALLSSMFLCIFLQGMEIDYTVKSNDECSPLLIDNPRSVYSYLGYEKKEDQKNSFSYAILHLPKEIQGIIIVNLFQTKESDCKQRLKKLIEKPALIVPGLKCFYDCTIFIGDKKIMPLEFLEMPSKHRELLYKTIQPGWLDRCYGIDGINIIDDNYYGIIKQLPGMNNLRISRIVITSSEPQLKFCSLPFANTGIVAGFACLVVGVPTAVASNSILPFFHCSSTIGLGCLAQGIQELFRCYFPTIISDDDDS